MAKAKQTQDIDALKGVLAAFPEGASLSQVITASAALGLPRNTLIRRLNRMVESGDLVKTGVSRNARYRLPVATPPAPVAAPEPIVVPLSPAAGEVRGLVKQPIALRRPVGYKREFLESYRPNVSFYLTEAERKHLAEIGRTPTPDEPAGTYAQHILNRLLIDLSFNSSRLEGNTYSLLDTERLIDQGETAEGKNATDAQMILNHKEAIEFLVQSADEVGFDRRTILNLHAKLADNLLPDPRAVGRLRSLAVGIGGSVYEPLSTPQVLDECFDQILATANAIEDPFEQAFFVMVHLPYLQPFEDVNKRVSRLAANIPLIRANLAPLSFVDVPKGLYTDAMLGVYEFNRIELLRDVFMWAYDRSAARYAAIRQTVGEPDPFRLRHRQALKMVVADVIKGPFDKKQAAKYVAEWAAKEIAEPERQRFIETAETELLNLHEGNFARYAVRPSEFDVWQKVWNAKAGKGSGQK